LPSVRYMLKQMSQVSPYFYLGDHRALIKTIYGHKMIIDTRDISLAPHLVVDGYWEGWVTEAFITQLKEGMHVIDIGANFGYYTLIAASKVGKNGKVYSFEADPEIAEVLFLNVEINGFLDRVKVINKAVYNTSQKIQFKKLIKHRGSSSIFMKESTAKQFKDKIETIEVETCSLDDFLLAEKNPRIDLIKIDAEGSEPFIFEGMQSLISQNQTLTIISEFAPAFFFGIGKDPKQFLKTLIEIGFKVCHIDIDGKIKQIDIDGLLKLEWTMLYLKKD